MPRTPRYRAAEGRCTDATLGAPRLDTRVTDLLDGPVLALEAFVQVLTGRCRTTATARTALDDSRGERRLSCRLL